MTAPPARRSLSELIAMYELEPTLRDVFVEGVDDSSVVRWYIRQRSQRTIAVYEIDLIDVPDGLVEEYKFDMGSAGRIRTLALHLDRVLRGDSRKCPTLLVDADFDHLFGMANPCSLLLVTEYCNFEMYLFSEAVIDRLTTLAVRGCKCGAKDILSHLAIPLQRLFFVRAANHSLGLGLPWIDFKKTCVVDGHKVQLDEDEFVYRYTVSAGRADQLENLKARVRALEQNAKGDPRCQMHGHDFLDMLRWYLREISKDQAPLANALAFGRMLSALVDVNELDASQTFQALCNRVNAA